VPVHQPPGGVGKAVVTHAEGQQPLPAQDAVPEWHHPIDIETCRACGGAVKVIACIEDPAPAGCEKRVALPEQGKCGGARTIVATKMVDRWFFRYGFGKNERANIDKDELKVFQEVAKDLLGFDDRQLTIALAAGEIVEVCNDNDEA
jgi:hypothetical protein